MSIGFRNESSRSIVMLDGVDRVAFNEDGSLELLTPAANPTGNKVMTVSQMPFTKAYVSPEQVITSAGYLTLPHSLPAPPVLLQAQLICKVASNGFAVGDKAFVDIGIQESALSRGLSVTPYTTTLGVKYGSNGNVFVVINKSTGTAEVCVNDNWRLIVRAWA